MFLFLSILLSNSFEAECTPTPQGAGGTCLVCDTNTNLCLTCNYAEEYQPDQNGGCTKRPQSKCVAIQNGDAGSCSECDTTADVCKTCNYPDDYEPNSLGNCSLKQKPQCTEVEKGAGGTCSLCDKVTNLCQICNYQQDYEPTQYGNCTKRTTPLRCVAYPKGGAGTCSECNTTSDLCQVCNYPDDYEPNELGNCTAKPPTRCVEKPNSHELGSCQICNKTSDLCQVCNDQQHYEPNELGNCTAKPPPNCVEIMYGAGGTCQVCNKTADVCQICNHPEVYQPDEFGNCTARQPICNETEFGAAGTCKTCNTTTNLCEICNYADKYEPDLYGTCSQKPYVKCVNVTDGAAGTCAKCSTQNNLCTACNYPEYFEPDQHGGCQIKTQAHCTEEWFGGPGTCSVCNPRTHLCEICNDQRHYSPSPFGNCTVRSRNGCSASVSNCFRCDPRNPDKCIECQYKYGLRGGYCTKCPAHLYEDSRHPCNPDCSVIPNCHVSREYDDDDCALENGHLYCLSCNHGFHPSEDYKTCIQDVPGNCSYQMIGCLECAFNGSRRCSKCDEEKGFVLDREDGECKCRKHYDLVLGQCLRDVKEVECDKSLDKCDKCAFNSSTCIECDDDYGLENNQCVKCPKGGYVSGELPCRTPCTSIPNCAFCSDDGKYCFKCQHDFEESDDHTKCVSEDEGPCNSTVIGCKKCSRSDPNYCLKCDKKLHFDESEVFPGTCVCDEDYDYYNGQCVEPFSPAIPPQGPSDQVQIDGKEFTKYVIVQGTIYTIAANASFLPGTLYILLVPITITQIIIPKGPSFFQLTIPNASSGVTVNADPSTQVDLSCPNGAQIVIPDNNNYILKGSGFITLNPPPGLAKVILKKILMDQSGNTIQLNSNNSDITVKEIEIYGHQTIAGQSISHHTICEITKIQSGATFTPENISLTVLKIGIQSVLQVKGNSNVDISDYQVYYNSTITKIPIQFISPFPNFRRSKLHIYNMNNGASLEEDETFNVASFTGENSQQACNDFKFDTAGSGFGSTECQTFGDTTYKVAKKAVSPDDKPNGGGKKKKGLSGGAIAGIVVGCVVAVGLVVFLCVWFLVVKKNQPAHKRSGEPANSREKLEI